MHHPKPTYTPDNCRPAYQLNWALTLFWSGQRPSSDWFPTVSETLAPDGIRLLNHRARGEDQEQLLLSTKPHIAPFDIVRLTKGRLQYALRTEHSRVLQRRFGIRSIGSATRSAVESYVETQVQHHEPADRRFADFLAQIQISEKGTALEEPWVVTHGRYWYGLHVVMVNAGRWREGNHDDLETIRDTAMKVAKKHDHRLSKAAVLPDHLHLVLGCDPQGSPQAVALQYMNNIAYRLKKGAFFSHSYYVGTIGEYSRGALAKGSSLHPDKPGGGGKDAASD